MDAKILYTMVKRAGDKIRSDGTPWTPAMKRAYYAKKNAKSKKD